MKFKREIPTDDRQYVVSLAADVRIDSTSARTERGPELGGNGDSQAGGGDLALDVGSSQAPRPPLQEGPIVAATRAAQARRTAARGDDCEGAIELVGHAG